MHKQQYRIMTYGLSQEENNHVITNFPKKDYMLLECMAANDLIAIDANIYIINSKELNEEEKVWLLEYYKEIGETTDGTIFLIGAYNSFKKNKDIVCFESFQEFSMNLNYYLLQAHNKSKKVRDFSAQLADCISILSMIHKQPGINTKEIAKRIEKSERTVIRYINTLRMAGEWIIYDSRKRGWVLEHGTSQLFEVYFEKGD